MKKVQGSSKFREAEQNAAPFFKDIKDYVFGRPTTMANAVSFRTIYFTIVFANKLTHNSKA